MGPSSNGTELLGKGSDTGQGITFGQPVLRGVPRALPGAKEHFRFTPRKLSELLQRGSRQLCAITGHKLGYSITSSARASTVAGTSRPSALAVLRLIASSNLVGCCTGKSAGLAPFRSRPT
jgi:hypothetical protein